MFRPSIIILAAVLCSAPVVAQVRLEGPDGPLVGDTTTCAPRGERAVECGSSNTGRPDLCCLGLGCSERSGGNLHMRCWTPEELAQQKDEEMGVPPPAPSASTITPPPIFAPPTFTLPVTQPTFSAGTIDPNNCAGEGDRAQQCGASANRAPMCCEGFVCAPGNAKVTCTSAAIVEQQVQEAQCAGHNGRAMECGAAAGRPPVCCPGHVCAGGAGVKCVALAPPTPPPVFGPTVEPTERPTRDPSFCAAVDERAIECGSNKAEHPDKCCPGLICRINQGAVNRPICVEPPPGYVFPTAFPTQSPTPSPTTPQPTPNPTTYPPTTEFMLGSSEPTSLTSGDGNVPSSSAFGLAVAYRSAVMVTAGVMLAALLM